jgi:hypothetical protein
MLGSKQKQHWLEVMTLGVMVEDKNRHVKAMCTVALGFYGAWVPGLPLDEKIYTCANLYLHVAWCSICM